MITVQIPAQVLQLCFKARPPQIRPLLFLLSLNISVLLQLWLPEDMKRLIHGDSSESSGWQNSFAWRASTEQFLSCSVTWNEQATPCALFLQSNVNSCSISIWCFRFWVNGTLYYPTISYFCMAVFTFCSLTQNYKFKISRLHLLSKNASEIRTTMILQAYQYISCKHICIFLPWTYFSSC